MIRKFIRNFLRSVSLAASKIAALFAKLSSTVTPTNTSDQAITDEEKNEKHSLDIQRLDGHIKLINEQIEDHMNNMNKNPNDDPTQETRLFSIREQARTIRKNLKILQDQCENMSENNKISLNALSETHDILERKMKINGITPKPKPTR